MIPRDLFCGLFNNPDSKAPANILMHASTKTNPDLRMAGCVNWLYFFWLIYLMVGFI